MFCSRCGAEIPPDQTDCPRCYPGADTRYTRRGGALDTDKLYVLIAHLGGVFSFIPALIIYFLAKGAPGDNYVIGNAREALNFQITVFLAYVVSFVFMLILIGFALIQVVYVANLIFCIVAAIRAYQGEVYVYPFSIRFVKA